MEDGLTTINPTLSPDCICDGVAPWCSPCVIAVAMWLHREHGETVSISMLKRRIPLLTGRQASLVMEATKLAADLRPDMWPIAPPEQKPPQLEPPKPQDEPTEEKVLLPYTEAVTLEAIRERPGITGKELGEALGLSDSTVKSRVKGLLKGRHVRAELHSYQGERGARFRRFYPTHDKPIGRVRPREHVRIARKRRGKDGLPND